MGIKPSIRIGSDRREPAQAPRSAFHLWIGRSALFIMLALPALAQPPPRPNILFALADDWGYGHAGAYGCKWVKTPAFDRVAKEGVLFTHAYTPTGKCAPSRASILTGRNPWQLKAAANHWCVFPMEFKSYPEALAERGYHVGMTGKGWAPGVTVGPDGKPRADIAGKPFNARKLAPPTPDISANDYAANFADFLDAAPKGQPWCFWFGGMEPHRAYTYGSGIALGGKKTSDIDRVPGYWPDNEVTRTDMLDYAFETEHFDAHLGRMLRELEARGMLGNTLIVVTSDNGMPFPHSKGQVYPDSNRLPFAVMWKDGVKNPGRTVDDYVSFIDLAPTFIEVTGVAWDATGMADAQGQSLTDVLFAEGAGRVAAGRDHVFIGRERNDVGRPKDAGYPVRGIVKDDFIYLHNFEPTRWPACNPETGYLDTDGSPTKTEVLKSRHDPATKKYWDLCFGKRGAEELYDLTKDPDCLVNLARDPALNARQNALRQLLFAGLVMQGDPWLLGSTNPFDRHPHANKKNIGFYEKFQRGELTPADAPWVNATDFESAIDD
ncbi:MAG: sulfatase [Kiritimatiellaeota bacterium]|nr:sulfatase [Kiritimatiellota bacterium]